MSEYFDLSQQIENGMTYFPGDPEPHIEPADTTPPWRVTHLHIGTHMGKRYPSTRRNASSYRGS